MHGMTTSSYEGVGAECFVDMTCLLPIEGFMVILIPEGGEARKTDRVAQGAGGGEGGGRQSLPVGLQQFGQ